MTGASFHGLVSVKGARQNDVTENRPVTVRDGVRGGGHCKEHHLEGIFGGDGSVLYLDYNNDHMIVCISQKS